MLLTNGGIFPRLWISSPPDIGRTEVSQGLKDPRPSSSGWLAALFLRGGLKTIAIWYCTFQSQEDMFQNSKKLKLRSRVQISPDLGICALSQTLALRLVCWSRCRSGDESNSELAGASLGRRGKTLKTHLSDCSWDSSPRTRVLTSGTPIVTSAVDQYTIVCSSSRLTSLDYGLWRWISGSVESEIHLQTRLTRQPLRESHHV